MKTKAKKQIYALGAICMAVVVFLSSLFFLGGKDSSSASTPDSEPALQESSQGAGLGGGGGESGGTDLGGGGESGGADLGGGGGKSFLFSVLTNKSQRIYLRQDSKGDYTGKGEHGFVGDVKYYLEDSSYENPLYYLGLTAKNSGMQAYQAEIELVNVTNELIPYAAIDKQETGEKNKYVVNYYPFDYLTDGLQGLSPMGQDVKYTVQEQLYYQFVRETYLNVPESLKQTLIELAQENNIEANSQTVITDVVSYIQNAAYYDYYYANVDYPDDKDMVTYFLAEHKRGVCRHFAAAATMMFRALGIPARYTIGFAVQVEANVKLEYDGDGHAWTEIYLQGYGWMPLEVTGGTIYTGGMS